MSKARMNGAFAPFTPNNKADARFNHKAYMRKKQQADNTTPREDRRWQKAKRESYVV